MPRNVQNKISSSYLAILLMDISLNITSILMKSGKMIIINGASSSGKSTVSKCLQDILLENYCHIGVDTFWLGIPPKQLI